MCWLALAAEARAKGSARLFPNLAMFHAIAGTKRLHSMLDRRQRRRRHHRRLAGRGGAVQGARARYLIYSRPPSPRPYGEKKLGEGSNNRRSKRLPLTLTLSPRRGGERELTSLRRVEGLGARSQQSRQCQQAFAQPFDGRRSQRQANGIGCMAVADREGARRRHADAMPRGGGHERLRAPRLRQLQPQVIGAMVGEHLEAGQALAATCWRCAAS